MICTAQAQKTAACCKAGGKSAVSCETKAPGAVSADHSAAAEKVAAMDQTIEKRSDPITGVVSYVRKETSVADGTVSFVSLSFDPMTNSFVNVAPSMMEENHGNCSMKTTTASGKSCCAKGAASGKSCCAGKMATAKPEKTKS